MSTKKSNKTTARKPKIAGYLFDESPDPQVVIINNMADSIEDSMESADDCLEDNTGYYVYEVVVTKKFKVSPKERTQQEVPL